MKLQDLIEKNRQGHILKFYETLSESDKKKLEKEIQKINFQELNRLISELENSPKQTNQDNVAPIDYVVENNLDDSQKQNYYAKGIETIARGEVGVVIFAGGQGSRLGYEGPKGMYDIGLPSKKTLFQIIIEKIKIRNVKGKTTPIAIMVNPETYEVISDFLVENKFFDYPKEDIYLFKQELFPAVDSSGKIIMKNKSSIAMSPNGNGNCFKSMKQSGVLDIMIERGVKWFSIVGIDNVLVDPIDPIFIGFSISQDKEISSKSVKKKFPEEKVGVFCNIEGRPSIIEYSDIEKLPKEQKISGYEDANILHHMVKVEFITEKALKKELPFHIAHKVIPYSNSFGEIIIPKKPNGYKFEQFIFDYFQYADGMAVFRVDRSKSFSPVKNKSGNDSPESAVKDFLALHKN